MLLSRSRYLLVFELSCKIDKTYDNTKLQKT